MNLMRHQICIYNTCITWSPKEQDILCMINRSSRISRSIQLNRGVRQHPDGRSGRGTAQHPAELVSRRRLGGLGRHPFRPTSLNSALTRVSRKNIPIVNIDKLIPEEVAKADGIKIVTRSFQQRGGRKTGHKSRLIPLAPSVARELRPVRLSVQNCPVSPPEGIPSSGLTGVTF
jgi:hypothetical protein